MTIAPARPRRLAASADRASCDPALGLRRQRAEPGKRHLLGAGEPPRGEAVARPALPQPARPPRIRRTRLDPAREPPRLVEPAAVAGQPRGLDEDLDLAERATTRGR